MEDEYYIDEEGYEVMDGEGGEEEETWETEVENTYYNAKEEMDKHPDGAIKGFEQVIADDQDKGKWTFKAYKRLVQTALRAERFDRMLDYYGKLLEWNWSGRTRNDTEKVITKLVDLAGHQTSISTKYLQKMYEVTLTRVEKEIRNYEKIWFNVKLKLCQLAFDTKDFDLLVTELDKLKSWCREGDGFDPKKGSQALSVFALEIQMHTQHGNNKKLRDLYEQAMEVKAAIPPPRIMGIIRECGGKMFMRQQQWKEALEAFFQAFRNFDEAGQPRRIQCLKYLVLATMLSGSKINPFDSNEARSYRNDPEIVAMTELIDACERNDLKLFESVLKNHKRSITEDEFLFSYLEPLIARVRAKVLIKITKPYTNISLQYVAQELNIAVDEAQTLAVSMILDGSLDALIDEVNGLLVLDNESSGDNRRYSALNNWVSHHAGMQFAVTQRAVSL